MSSKSNERTGSVKVAREFLELQKKKPEAPKPRPESDPFHGDNLAQFLADHLDEFEDAEILDGGDGTVSARTRAAMSAAIDEFERREEAKQAKMIPLLQQARRRRSRQLLCRSFLQIVPALLTGFLAGAFWYGNGNEYHETEVVIISEEQARQFENETYARMMAAMPNITNPETRKKLEAERQLRAQSPRWVNR